MAKQSRDADQRFTDATDSSRRIIRRAMQHHYEACAVKAAGCATGLEAAQAFLSELRRPLGDGPDSAKEKRCATLRKDAR